jgi:hypothetical protein
MKQVFRKLTVTVIVVTTLMAGCQEESLKPVGDEPAAICNTCPEPPEPADPKPVPPPPVCVSKPDLIVTTAVRGSSASPTLGYTVTIKNIGTATANLDHFNNKFFWQGWLSTNGVAKNVAACGSYFYQTIAPGQTATASIGCMDINASGYSYLIIETWALTPGLLNECNTANNKKVISLPLL